MAKATPVNPFTAAKVKPTAALKPDSPIFLPADTTTYDGGHYKAADIIDAVNNYAKGNAMEKEADAMQKASRPTILAVARTLFAMDWLKRGTRPSTPKMYSDPQGKGSMLSIIFMDKSIKMDDNRYATLCNLIGADNAQKNTTQRDDFSFNPDLLEDEVEVKKDGKIIKQKVMTAIAEALQDKFAPSPAILANLFHITPKFETNKGLLDKLPQFVAKDGTVASAHRLAQAMVDTSVVTQIKPGSTSSD